MGCFFWCPRNSNKKKKLDSNDLKAQVVIGFKATAQDQDYNPSTPADASTFNRRSDCKKDVNGKGKESEHASPSSSAKEPNIKVESNTSSSKVRIFAYQQLVDATENFRSDCFLGEGGFGRVYKGQLADTNKVVAIKQLDHNGLQGIRGFVVEVLILSQTDHPNLMKLMGYCAERDQRLLVYEYMPLGSLEHYLHDQRPKQKALDWNTRMKIAAGVARAIEYLHDKMKPPIIYRDLKCSSILLAKDYHPKLSNFGLAKVGPVGEKTHVSTRVMGTHGCCAPEYAMTGQLTFKSDVYSVGVVLLEIITGRKAIDNTKDAGAQNLVAWARPMFKDKRKFGQMADPALKGGYPIRGLYQALAVAAMCVQEQPNMRPPMADVVTALNYLASQKYDPQLHAFQCQRTSSSTSRMITATRENADKKVDVARDRLESG